MRTRLPSEENHIRLAAYSFMATGVIHTGFGIIFGQPILREMFKASLVNNVATHYEREAIFWFLFAGFMMIVFGMSLLSAEHISKFLAWSLLVVVLIASLMQPASGLWLLLLVAMYMLWVAHTNPSKAAFRRFES